MAAFATTAEEIHGLIDRYSDDQHAWACQLEEATQAQVRAEAALESARDLADRARSAITQTSDEITRLRVELAELVPEQQAPDYA